MVEREGGGEPFLKCDAFPLEWSAITCPAFKSQFYWDWICRIVVELVLWQVINDLPVWQFANAHKGMRKNAGSENLSFCQNSTAIFRGRSPSFSELRQREVRHFLRGVQYWPYAHKVMWKVPHLSSGKKAILISSFNNFKSTTLVHYTLNQNRLFSGFKNQNIPTFRAGGSGFESRWIQDNFFGFDFLCKKAIVLAIFLYVN